MVGAYTKFLIRRALQAIPVLFGLSLLIFTISRLIPGDPVRLALGPQATEEQVARMEADMALDRSIHEQYLIWMSGVFRGDWGTSLITGNNVFNDIVALLPATIELVILGMAFAIVLAIPLGMIAGTNQNRWEDHTSRIGALIGTSMPRFWLAIILQIIFVSSLGLFPLTRRLPPDMDAPPRITGMYLFDSLLTLDFITFLYAAWHITLPMVALGLVTVATLMRLIRSEVIDQLSKDYTTMARASGLPRTLIYYKYVLRNSFSSSLTIIGLQVGFLIGGSFLVEFVFNWPGFSAYGVAAIVAQDLNAMVGVVIVVGFGFVMANLIVDLLYGYLDPRVRLSVEAE